MGALGDHWSLRRAVREECCEKGAEEGWSAVDMEAMEKLVHVASAGNVTAAVMAANINPGCKDLEEDWGGKATPTKGRGEGIRPG